MVQRLLIFGLAVALLYLPTSAVADWSDNFDSYAAGTKMDNVGGWAGWDNVSSAAGTISDVQALSRPNSMSVSNGAGSDAVHPFSGYTSGTWVFTAWQYLPDNLDGLTYFIINNEYNHSGPYDWAIEDHMDPTSGMVYEAVRDPNGLNPLPIVWNQWVEIRTEIDLDNDWMEHYYNNQLLASGVWAVDGGLIEIQNVDLYAPHNVDVYYDDLSLVPEPSAILLLFAGTLMLRRR
ncbi:MAG: PEP-CTERM sorting domain-containing protein [Planctomycetes bacterium]|nr:PEP-CTERM sorting domain-containing protein [Planctomycetota bacterium]